MQLTSILLFLKNNFTYLLLAVLGLCCCSGFSPVARSWGYSLAAVLGLLTELVSLVEHRLQSAGSVVVVHGLSCSKVCEIFLDQGLNPRLMHWQSDS